MSTPQIKTRVKNSEIEAYWSLNLDNTHCPLCKRDLADITKDNIEKSDPNNKIIVGKCNHGLHDSCIYNWIKSGNNTCPIDRTDWKIEGDTVLTLSWDTVSKNKLGKNL